MLSKSFEYHRLNMISRFFLLLSLLPVTAWSSEEAFQQYIQPILETRCVSCHGSERQKGGLRLDTLEGALKGGDAGPAFVPGDPSNSLLIELVNLHAEDDERMPPKDEPLNKRQKSLLSSWINAGAPWAGTLVAREPYEVRFSAVPATGSRDQLLEDPELLLKHSRVIDQFVNGILSQKGITPNRTASDEVFVRRAYLDIGGRIPTLGEYEAFMASVESDKRDRLIRQLLDSDAFVSHTHNQWQDALRVKDSHRKIDMTSYKVWLRKAIQENMPYDQFVREQLITSGHIENPEAAAVGYIMRDRGMPDDRVATTMQLFLGTSMVCAQCHDHPTDKWTQMDYYKLLSFFNGTVSANGGALGMTEALQENGATQKGDSIRTADGVELHRIRTEQHYKVLGDVVMVGGYGKVRLPDNYAYNDADPNDLIRAGTPFGNDVEVDYSKVYEREELAVSNKTMKFMNNAERNDSELSDVNSRAYFAEWATSPENPMFTKTIVNRLWSRVFGVPLVGDLVNISETHMGPSPELTAFLVSLMKSVAYDQKLFLEVLYQTDAYERVALDPPTQGEMPIGAPVVRRLSSEQIWDSLVAIRSPEPDAGVTKGTLTSRNVMYLEMNKREGDEQWAFVADTRPLAKKADPELAGELTADDKFDLNKRASLLPSPGSAAGFLGVFGQADREVVDDSVQEATITQALYLMNSEVVESLATPKAKRGQKSSELVERLRSYSELNEDTITLAYNAILSRDPSDQELGLVESYLEEAGMAALQDLVWSLVNTNEFKLKR